MRVDAVQKQFLAGLHVPEAWKVYWNFPYLACPEGSDTPLWRASLHNFQQFILASGRRYRRAARAHSRTLVHSTEHLLVVALSCGLEILNSVLAAGDGIPGTGPHMLARIRVVALGPVAWKRPAVPHTLVQGEHDYLSKLFFRNVDVVLPRLGHMAYVQNPRVAQLVNESLCGSTST